MVDSVDCLVVGAGVVGLAVARAFAESGRDVLVVEREPLIGSITSSRNSEVIHAGIYYPPSSLKGQLCVRGKELLYAYCDARGIPYRRCQKLIVAADASEVPGLEDLAANAAASGVDDLALVDGAEARRLEPELRCHKALLSPSSGIIDSHQYMAALEADIAAANGTLALHSTVTAIAPMRSRLRVTVASENDGTVDLDCRVVVNAAGLGAQAVARQTKGLRSSLIPTQKLAKGSYFVLPGKPPFSRLVYPMPTRASLGLHYSVDLGGQARFGPDVQWIDEIDYTVDGSRAATFESSIRRYFPNLPPGVLYPGYAGVRPKVAGPGDPPGDFVIQDAANHGIKGLVNLFGIESPGLTASLAIGNMVCNVANR